MRYIVYGLLGSCVTLLVIVTNLSQRVQQLESQIKPLAIHQKMVCDGKSDDFYEEFARTIIEQCEEGRK